MKTKYNDGRYIPIPELKEIVFSSLKGLTQESRIKYHFPLNYEELMSWDFPKDFSFIQKLYHYLNGDKEFKLIGKCECGNTTNFNSIVMGYYTYCSVKCQQNSKKNKQKCKETRDSHTEEENEQIHQNRIIGCSKRNYILMGKRISSSWKLKSDNEIKEIVNKRKQTYINNPEILKCWKEKIQTTWNNKTDEEIEEIVKYCKLQNLLKNGDENYVNSQKIRETMLNKSQEERKNIYNKVSQTIKNKPDYIKQEIYNKVLETKRKNNTFTQSQVEEGFKKYLENNNIEFISQYKKDKRYPFACDFYIPKYDLFIEIQGSWTHGKHPFNENDLNDLELLNFWKSRNTDYYNSAIDTWTKRDVMKRKIANDNCLNFIEVFSNREEDVINQFIIFVNNKIQQHE